MADDKYKFQQYSGDNIASLLAKLATLLGDNAISEDIYTTIENAIEVEQLRAQNAEVALGETMNSKESALRNTDSQLGDAIESANGRISTIQGVLSPNATTNNKLTDKAQVDSLITTALSILRYEKTIQSNGVRVGIKQENGKITSLVCSFTLDSTPDEGSNNAVTSKGIRAALDEVKGFVDTEASERANQDSVLQDNIQSESQDRAEADDAIQQNLTNHTGNSTIHVTATDKTTWNGKQDNISDLATIRSGASAGATAYQKPSSGIPATDLSSGVQSSLNKADNAAPQSSTYTKTEVDAKDTNLTQKMQGVGNASTSGSTDTQYQSGYDPIFYAGNFSNSDYNTAIANMNAELDKMHETSSQRDHIYTDYRGVKRTIPVGLAHISLSGQHIYFIQSVFSYADDKWGQVFFNADINSNKKLIPGSHIVTRSCNNGTWSDYTELYTPAETNKLGMVKLYNSGGTNRSGLVIQSGGALCVNVASEYGLSRSGDGKVIANIRRSATSEDIAKVGTQEAPSVAAITTANLIDAVEKALEVTGDISDITILIPSAATAQNQLADRDYVDSSIATASATFRGTYNLVADLGLTPTATRAQIASALATKMSSLSVTPANNDYAYVQIPASEATPMKIADIDRYKYNGTSWGYEYGLDNSGLIMTANEAQALFNEVFG